MGLGRKTTLLHTGQGPYWLEVGYALLEVDYALGGRRYPCVGILIGVGDRVVGLAVGRCVAPRAKTKCLNLSNAVCFYMIFDSIAAVLRFGGCESCDYCRWTAISGRRPHHVAISCCQRGMR